MTSQLIRCVPRYGTAAVLSPRCWAQQCDKMPWARESSSAAAAAGASCPFLRRSRFGAASNAVAEEGSLPSSEAGRGLEGGESSTAVTAEGYGRVKLMSELDGPPAWPIVGNFLTYLKKENRGNMHKVQARLHKVHGKMFREKWGSNWQVHISDPDLISMVYRNDGKYPNRPPIKAWELYRDTKHMSRGLITAQGTDWHTYRGELGKRMLCPEATLKFIEPFNSVSEDLVKRLRRLRDGEGEAALVAKLPNEMYKWSLEAAGAFLFETRLGCLDEKIPEQTQRFINAIQEMMTSTLFLIVGEQLHKRFKTRFWKQHEHAWDQVFETGKELIDKRVEELKKVTTDEDCNLRGSVYLSYLLENPTLTMGQIYANMTELLLGGTDTTANTFCFAVHLLATNSKRLERLNDEVWRVLKGRTMITKKDLDSLTYLQCVIKETMRLYPVATMNCRLLDNDIILDGFLIPKKTLFVLNHYATGRDEAVFRDPDQFLPERWMRSEMKGIKHHPFGCLPFGFGSRSCIGRRVAKMELTIVLVKVLQNFSLEEYPNAELKPILRTLLTPGDHVPVRLNDKRP